MAQLSHCQNLSFQQIVSGDIRLDRTRKTLAEEGDTRVAILNCAHIGTRVLIQEK